MAHHLRRRHRHLSLQVPPLGTRPRPGPPRPRLRHPRGSRQWVALEGGHLGLHPLPHPRGSQVRACVYLCATALASFQGLQCSCTEEWFGKKGHIILTVQRVDA